MGQTHVILDGLQDPHWGQTLSARWAQAGFDNAVDLSAQCAWLAPGGVPKARAGTNRDTLSEADLSRALGIARSFGVELRDRPGVTFRADNDLGALRQKMVHEYKSRLATALVFGLPALVLHYVAPRLAGGTGSATSMATAWLIELLLVGWVCIAAGGPILWQGALSLIHRRATGDLLTSAIVVTAIACSVIRAIGAIWKADANVACAANWSPMLFAANLVITIAVLQRWLLHRTTPHLSGKAMLLIPRFSWVVGGWLVVTILTLIHAGLEAGLAIGMVFPPLIGLGAVNHRTPGPTAVLPVFAFAGMLLLVPQTWSLDIEGLRIEIAAGFALIMVAAMAMGWRSVGRGVGSQRAKQGPDP